MLVVNQHGVCISSTYEGFNLNYVSCKPGWTGNEKLGYDVLI